MNILVIGGNEECLILLKSFKTTFFEKVQPRIVAIVEKNPDSVAVKKREKRAFMSQVATMK